MPAFCTSDTRTLGVFGGQMTAECRNRMAQDPSVIARRQNFLSPGLHSKDGWVVERVFVLFGHGDTV